MSENSNFSTSFYPEGNIDYVYHDRLAVVIPEAADSLNSEFIP
jgi:hypothetical protein